MSAFLRRSLAMGTLLTLVISTSSVSEFVSGIVPTVDKAEAYTIHTTTLSPRSGPFLQTAGGGFQNPGGHWRGLNRPTEGNNPTLLASSLIPGSKIFGNISGTVNWGSGTDSCKDGHYNDNLIPKLVAIGQFTNDANIVVAIPGGGVNNTHSFYLKDLAAGVFVPAGATRLWISYPDSGYGDNNGTCNVVLNANPVGIVDAANCTDGIYGWAYDSDKAYDSIDVHMYADGPAGTGRFIAAATANDSRADLQPVLGSSNHGYHFAIPEILKDGQSHVIYVYGINYGSGNNSQLTGTPKTIQCGQAPTPGPIPCFGTTDNYFAHVINMNGNTNTVIPAGFVGYSLNAIGGIGFYKNNTTCAIPVDFVTTKVLGNPPNINTQTVYRQTPAFVVQPGTNHTFQADTPPCALQVDLRPFPALQPLYLNDGRPLVHGAIDYSRGPCDQPPACDIASIKQAITQQKIRFNRTANNDGFLVWNDTDCNLPVTAAVFTILDTPDNQSLYNMGPATVPAHAQSYPVTLERPTTGCIWVQYDLAFGSYPTLPRGTSLAAFNNAVNWATTGLSAYSFGGPCTTPPPCDITYIKGAITQGKIRFDRAPGNNGFLIWNDTSCTIPVTQALFTILDTPDNQSLYDMRVASVPPNVAAYPLTLNYPPSSCVWIQNDLVFGQFPILPRGTTLAAFNTAVNWAVNGISAYAFGGPCSSTPTLTLTKTAPQNIVRGSTITYRLTLKNTGTSNAQNLLVTDSFPSPLVFNPSFLTDTRCHLTSSQTVACDVASLGAGQQTDFNLSFDVPAVANCSGQSSVTNVANVSANGTAIAISNPAKTFLDCPATPNLQFRKTAAQSVIQRGNDLTYFLTVVNTGQARAQNIVLTDTIPQITGGTIVYNGAQSYGRCLLSGYTVSCPVGSLDPGQTISIPVVFTVGSVNDACAPGSNVLVTNFANLTATSTSSISAASAPTTVQCANNGSPHLRIQKVPLQNGISRGGVAFYKISITNDGTALARNVIAYDYLSSISNGSISFNQSLSSPACIAGPSGINQGYGAPVYGPPAYGSPLIPRNVSAVCFIQNLSPNQTVSVIVAFNIGSTVDQCLVGSNESLSNRAEVRSADGQFDSTTSQPVSVQCTNNGTPTLSIQKTPNQSQIQRGGIASYTINVTNSGQGAAQNVVITDPIPTIQNGSVTFNAGYSSNGCSVVGTNVVCSIASLSPGQTLSLTLAFNVGLPTDQCDLGSFVNFINTARVQASNYTSPVGTTAQAVRVNCITPTPLLSIMKTSTQSSVQRGGVLRYTIQVNNNGSAPANGVVVTDQIPSLPGGTITLSPSNHPNFCTQQGNTVVCNVPQIPVNNGYAFGIDFIVGALSDQCTPGTSTNIINTASATIGSSSAPATVNASPVTVTCVNNGTPTLSITKTPIQQSIQRGGVETYNVTVTNNGNAPATNVFVRDPVPTISNGTVTFAPGSSSQVCGLLGNNQVQCSIGTINPGQSAVLTIAFTVGAINDSCTQGTNATLNNTAFTQGSGITEVSANSSPVSVQCVTGTPSLSITKTPISTSINRGGLAVYTINVNNNGTAAAQNVVVTDAVPTIPNGTVTFVAASSSNICSVQNGIVTCNIGTLPAGLGSQVTLAFLVGSTGDTCAPGSNNALSNSASVNATNIAPQSVTAQAVTVSCTNNGTPSLSITKTPVNSSISRGGLATYNIVVTNTGNAAAQNVVVTDAVPSIANGTVTFNANASTNICSLQGTNVVCNVGTLAAGANATIALAFTVGAVSDSCTPNSTASLANTATVAATGVTTQTAVAQSVSVTCTNNGTPSLTITKTPVNSSINRGGTATYSIVVTNTGNAAAQNVVVTDPVPTISNGTVTFNANSSATICSVSNGVVTCNVGALAAGANATIALAFTVGSTADSCSPGSTAQLANSASVVATSIASQTANAQSVNVSCTNSGTPSLSFTKVANQSTVQRGGIATYNLTVTNNGTAAAQNVVITDPTPLISNGVVNFNSSASSNICSQQGVNIVCNVGTLNAGAIAQVVVGFTVGSVTDSCVNGSTASLANTASVSATGITTVSASANSVNVQCNVATGNLSIFVTDNQTTIAPGAVDTYVITVTNPSSVAQTNQTVTATLYSLLTFQNASENGFLNGQTVTWNNVTIPANGNKTLTFQAQVQSGAANGSYIVTNAYVNGQTSSDTTTVQTGTTSNSILISVTDDPDPVDSCANITYTIRLTNTSSQTATNVNVDQLFSSSNLSFSSASDGGYQNGNGVRWTNLTLNAGAQRVLSSVAKVSCSANNGDILRSTISTQNFSVDTSTLVSGNGTGSDGDLSISATGDPDDVSVGDTIEYTIKVTNDGNTSRTVDVRAELDSDTSFLNASNNGDDRNDTEVLWKAIRIDRDETRTLRLEARVRNTADDGQNLRMEVRIPGDSDTVTTRVADGGGSTGGTTGGGTPVNNVSVTKSADRFEANPGDSVTYTVTIRNTSTKKLTAIDVSDTFPSELFQVTEAGGGAVTSGGVRWSIDLGANQIRTLVYRGRISAGARPGETVHNSVLVSGNNISGAGSSADVRILGQILPQTGAGEYTGPLEDTSRFLSFGQSGSSSTGIGGLLALLGSAIASVGGGFLVRRKFF